MKFLFEFLPIIVFFIAYQIAGIYAATASAMLVSLLQIAWQRFKKKQVPTMQWVTLSMILVLGSATLILHNPIFIKWKPSIVSWAFALAFLISHFIGKKSILARLLDKEVQLPAPIWQRLNISWILFFTFMGILNLIVVYNFSTEIWVYFKLFGTLGLTVVFIIIQALYIGKHLPVEPPKK
jgi:intracellular septation protein